MEEDFKEHCDEKGHRTLLLSVDVQGLKAVNDNIEHSKGTEVLTEYGEALEAAAEKADNDHFKEKKGVTAFARAYHIGGDEFAMVFVAPEASLPNQVAKEITEFVAAIEPIVKVTAKGDKIPTMLRVGACVGAGEGEAILSVADKAETDVRCAIYNKAFGSMDARGAFIAKNDPKLKGTANWRVQEYGSSKKYIGGLSDEAVKEAKDAAEKESEAKKEKSKRTPSCLTSRQKSRPKPSLSDSRATSTSRSRAQGPQVRSKRGPTPSKKKGGGK